ncbi:hypothetical protein GCM10010910_03790 [Microbacterium nanhaiense]|uniref:Secreted protein n=1 Tax=Microbacterium nanhaiense TaxID=1301026 RepID=A0ABQ2N196_9MICO|nr:hypothetical protein [Microbacterium nanhaiense]GGO59844.1 hypothetical protein GCM10010910_03790 [Microbacterium nanhaiense]
MKERALPRARLIALASVGATLTVVAGIAVYGLLRGPDQPSEEPAPAPDATPGPAPVLPVPHESIELRPPAVQGSSDPETFVRHVAEALFTWDTASGFVPNDYTDVLVDVGDPSGAEQPGLVADVAGYLPSHEAWVELRKYETRQWIAIDTIAVPAAWGTALEQAQPGQLAPGTIAYTVDGTRHRDGVWNDDAVAAERPVAFTAFVLCPTDPTDRTSCALLRLSQVDHPLR